MIPSTRVASAVRQTMAKRLWLIGTLASVWLVSANAEEGKASTDEHAGHVQQAAATEKKIQRSEHAYQIPDVRLTRQDGSEVSLPKELDDGRAVIMNFIFTSCSSVCPMLSHVFAQVQKKLGKDIGKVHLVSITIDPEQDTPEQLQAYAKRYKAGPQWDFYTGSAANSITVQKAFDAYRGDKMNHPQIILMRQAPGKTWVRLGGLVEPDVVVNEYRHD